jgi:hypothetical protein
MPGAGVLAAGLCDDVVEVLLGAEALPFKHFHNRGDLPHVGDARLLEGHAVAFGVVVTHLDFGFHSRAIIYSVRLREKLGISALRIDVEPWTPRADQSVFCIEPFSDRVVREIGRVGETHSAKNSFKGVGSVPEDMFNAVAQLARCCAGLQFPVIGQHEM